MLSYTIYSEAGGVGKTTLTANLAVAHARAGLDVLVIPLDPQDGDLSHLFGIDDHRSDSTVDHLVKHLVSRNEGDFYDLIHEDVDHPQVDIIPEHNMLEDLGAALRKEQEARKDFGESFPMNTQLRRVLREAQVNQEYDVMVIDPPASTGPALYNAIAATANLVLPVEPSGKGQASVSGLEEIVANLEDRLEMTVGVLAAVANRVKNTRDQEMIVNDLKASEYDVPAVFGDRTSLFEGCWNRHCSAYTYVRDHRDRQRDYEIDTLAQFDELARHIEQKGGVSVPSPPEPGDLADPELEA